MKKIPNKLLLSKKFSKLSRLINSKEKIVNVFFHIDVIIKN